MQKQNNKMLLGKSFARLLALAISILVLLACLCTSSWAWFSQNVSTSNNVIKSVATFDLTVTLSKDGTDIADIEEGVELLAGETYTVTLSLPKDSASGYVGISTVGDIYYSDYILRHTEDTPKTISFTLTVATTQTVEINTFWGIYSFDSDVVSGVMHIA